MLDNGRNLREITTKNDRNAAKGDFFTAAAYVTERSVKSFKTVSVLHWNFIPNYQASISYKISEVTVLFDSTNGLLVDIQRNCEARVRCTPTRQQQGSNAENNLFLASEMTQIVVHEGFTGASWTLQKEMCVVSTVVDGGNDSVKDTLLSRIYLSVLLLI